MMTSTLSTPQQQTEGRTVREIVDNNQEMVNEPWCRRIIRQVLQSLELQYAMQMPHRPITPDTLLVLDSGDPMLLPTPGTVPGDTEAGDIYDLAAVIHYAITHEPGPQTPLRGRPLPDYSDSFITAIDRCLSRNMDEQPKTIEQLRNLLGIVVLGPAISSQSPAADGGASPPIAQFAASPEPTSAPSAAASDAFPAAASDAFPAAASDAPPAAQLGRLQRWLLLAGVATVLLAGLAALVALLHDADSRDALALVLPEEQAAAGTPRVATAPSASNALAADGDMLPTPGPGAARSIRVWQETAAPAATADSSGAPPTAVTVLPAATQPGTTYKLLIKPWGTIVVNGVNRGVSPPLKRLSLPAGQHTIRIINPSFPEHTVTVQSVKGETAVIELDFTEEEPE